MLYEVITLHVKDPYRNVRPGKLRQLIPDQCGGEVTAGQGKVLQSVGETDFGQHPGEPFGFSPEGPDLFGRAGIPGEQQALPVLLEQSYNFV